MFQLETEDMLPRMAPKPSPDIPSGATGGIVRPQVPEVSILFGQSDANLPQSTVGSASQLPNGNTPRQTYAAWKKQMMPKVSYSASANMIDVKLQDNNMMTNDYNSARTNLYPTRSITTGTMNMASNAKLSGFGSCIDGSTVVNQLIYRRSLENCENINQQIQHLPAVYTQPPFTTLSNLPNRNADVLTICAGTQTDANSDSMTGNMQNLQSDFCANLASRKDVENIRQILDELKTEQKHILKILEQIFLNQHSEMMVKPKCQDIGVQVDFVKNDNEPYVNGEIAAVPVQEPLVKNKFLHHFKPTNNTLQTPKGKPIAQSTTYRPNSPQFNALQPYLPEEGPVKSTSETSLAMNELALKYLPNEKLFELLKELNIGCPVGTESTNIPARVNTEKFEKSPSDISNASYKYLKKYRLLPDHEENNDSNQNDEIERLGENGSEPQFNTPPINHAQAPTNKWSPYGRRLPLSPLVTAPQQPLHSPVTQNTVNLENIKHQPKLL